MFDLEQSIVESRKQMLVAGIKTPVPLEELENHLREEIERRIKSAVSGPIAFQIAVEKVGRGIVLQNEFKKVEPSKKARNWRFFEIFFWVNTLLIPLFVGSQAFFFKAGGFSEMNASQQMSILTAAVAFSLLAWVMRLSCGKFSVILTNQMRDAILVPVVFGVVILAYIILPRFDFTENQRAVVSMWAFAPFGILIGWAWGFATAARKKVAMTGS